MDKELIEANAGLAAALESWVQWNSGLLSKAYKIAEEEGIDLVRLMAEEPQLDYITILLRELQARSKLTKRLRRNHVKERRVKKPKQLPEQGGS